MTKEEIMTLDSEALEKRAEEIASETVAADVEKIEALNAELDAIEERRTAINLEIETRKKAEAEVLKGKGEIIEERKEEIKMDNKEFRNSPEYLDAWVEMQKGRATVEQRALLTTNAENGTVAIPTYVEEKISTAWENNELFSRIRKTYFPGNLKVGYERTAGAADVHHEGDTAIAEETLELGIVELIPQMVKKWISFSDEALDMRGEAFVDYIVDEITDKIIKEVIMSAVVSMVTSGLSNGTVGKTQGALQTEDIIHAEGLLSGDAADVVLITTRQQAANLKAAALGANYGFDPTDGLPIIYVDSFPTNFDDDYLGIVADLSGVTANFPNGEEVKIKIDDLTLATSDMVKVIGRLYVAIGVTAIGKVAFITDKK